MRLPLKIDSFNGRRVSFVLRGPGIWRRGEVVSLYVFCIQLAVYILEGYERGTWISQTATPIRAYSQSRSMLAIYSQTWRMDVLKVIIMDLRSEAYE